MIHYIVLVTTLIFNGYGISSTVPMKSMEECNSIKDSATNVVSMSGSDSDLIFNHNPLLKVETHCDLYDINSNGL